MPLLGRGYAVGKRLLNTHPKLKSQEIYIEPEPIEPIEIHFVSPDGAREELQSELVLIIKLFIFSLRLRGLK